MMPHDEQRKYESKKIDLMIPFVHTTSNRTTSTIITTKKTGFNVKCEVISPFIPFCLHV